MSIRDKCARLFRSPGRLTTGLLALTLTATSAFGVTAAAAPVTTQTGLAQAGLAQAGLAQAGLAQAGLAQPSAVPAPPAGFTTTWSDDFSGAANSALDTGTWRYDAGPGASFGTGEIETTTTSTANVYQDGSGHLVLKALRSGGDPSSGWTSGRVETQGDGFGAQPGGVVRVQASIQQPNLSTANGAGYWPAFWMLGAPLRVGVPWPGSGEVDILEDVNGRSSVFGTLHCGVNPGGPCNEGTGIGSGERACGGCQTGYHTYAVEIDRSTSPEQIRWYLDGANYFTLNSGQVDAATWANAVDHSFFVIFDLAIGGVFPAGFGGGPNAATASGGSLNVDYVAVYNKSPDHGPNIAQGKPTTASSAESAQFSATNATDGDITTRWSSGFSDPQWLQVDLGQNYSLSHATLTWEAAAASAYQIQTSTDNVNWSVAYTNTNSPQDIQSTPLSGTARYVRVNATSRASQWGDSLYELALYGTPGSGNGGSGNTLLSQGKTATASSSESAGFTAGNAVDGNTDTRWSSQFGDPQWLEVDLGASHSIGRVDLNWETAYAKAFQIQVSNDDNTWTNLTPVTAGVAGPQSLTVSGSGRYVRMLGAQRATQWGYSLWEFQVYGS